MTTTIQIGELTVEVTQKAIKNLHLSVHPPLGRVSIAAPRHLTVSAIRAFAIGKLTWIRQEQAKLREQDRETPREFVHRESHYVWGRRCLLSVVERDAPPAVDWSHTRLTLMVRPGMDEPRRGAVLEAWYRAQLREALAPLTAEWQSRLARLIQRGAGIRWRA
jgi:predicted metal-dependent hydrolase